MRARFRFAPDGQYAKQNLQFHSFGPRGLGLFFDALQHSRRANPRAIPSLRKRRRVFFCLRLVCSITSHSKRLVKAAGLIREAATTKHLGIILGALKTPSPRVWVQVPTPCGNPSNTHRFHGGREGSFRGLGSFLLFGLNVCACLSCLSCL